MTELQLAIGLLVGPAIYRALEPDEEPQGVPVPRVTTPELNGALNALPADFGVDYSKAKDVSHAFRLIRAAIESVNGRGMFRGVMCTRLYGNEAVRWCDAMLAAANSKSTWVISSLNSLMYDGLLRVQMRNDGVAEIPDRQLNPFGRAMRDVYAARLVALAAKTAPLSNPCAVTNACARLAVEVDSLVTPWDFPLRSLVDSFKQSALNLPDTLDGAVESVGGAAAGLAVRAVGVVLMSTPVLMAGIGYLWWRYA